MHLHDTERLVRLAIDGDRHAACELISNLKHHGDLEGARRLAYLMILWGEPHTWKIRRDGEYAPLQVYARPFDHGPLGYLTHGTKFAAIAVCGGMVAFEQIGALKKTAAKTTIDKENRKSIQCCAIEMMYSDFPGYAFPCRMAAAIVNDKKPAPAGSEPVVLTSESIMYIARLRGFDARNGSRRLIYAMSNQHTYPTMEMSVVNKQQAARRLIDDRIKFNLGARMLIKSDYMMFKDIIFKSTSGTEAQQSILGAIQKEVERLGLVSVFDFEETGVDSQRKAAAKEKKKASKPKVKKQKENRYPPEA